MLKYALLGLLRHQPMSGYDLEQFINASTAHFWHAKLSQIYRTLKQLEADEYVLSHIEPQEGRPDRRVYRLTDKGRDDLKGWLAEYVTEPDEIKLPSLLRFFFFGEAEKEHIVAQLRLWHNMYSKQQAHFVEVLPGQIEALKASVPHNDTDPVFWEATRRFGEMYYAMYVRWLEETLRQLEDEL